MRLVVTKEWVRQVLRWSRRGFLAAGIGLLSYCAFILLDSWIFQRQQAHDLERLLHVEHAAGAGTTSRKPIPALEHPSASATGVRSEPLEARLVAPEADGLIGRIEISRLGLSAVVVEGIDNRTLRRAVGHIPGTPLPGQPGNVGIAGHRDTFFRPLRDIQVDDIITLTTPWGEFRYRVVSSRVVSPDDVEVLYPTDNEVLTLVTCHPFYFVGPAPDRFIVRAEKVS